MPSSCSSLHTRLLSQKFILVCVLWFPVTWTNLILLSLDLVCGRLECDEILFSHTLLAGWYSLAATKTYIQLHPSENVAVLDSSASVGGVWARERLYPGLNSNNMLGMYEYSDFPMDEATFGVAPGQHIPGTVVHSYLTKYAEHFGVYGRICFNTLVETVEHHERGG